MHTKYEVLKRYIFLFGGLMVNAIGVVLLAKSCLGTSPMGSIPYIFSMKFPVSLGIFTFLLYILMFLVQVIILRKNLTKKDWLQLPLSVIYSFFIDIVVACLASYVPVNYGIMMGCFLFGCLFRALGVSMQVTADVAMLSGEAFMVVIAKAMKKDFAKVKLVGDIVMVIISVVTSILFFGKIEGIREGTVISMIIIAPITGIFNRQFEGVAKRFAISRSAYTIKKKFKDEDNNFIITISSQSGSGGHAIGKLLSRQLDLPLYDNNLPDMIAEEGGFAPEYVRERMGKLYTNKFWEFYVENYSYTGFYVDSYEPLFETQKRVIDKLANTGNCIIVGYCSEYLLKEHKNVFSIYIHANEDAKMKFLSKEYKVTSKKARGIMREHDHDRSLYFRHFTGEKWENPDRYSLSLDSSILGIEKSAEVISDVIKCVIKNSKVQ